MNAECVWNDADENGHLGDNNYGFDDCDVDEIVDDDQANVEGQAFRTSVLTIRLLDPKPSVYCGMALC